MCRETQLQEEAQEPVERLYIGESSRTLAIRAGQHVKDCEKASKTSSRPKDPDLEISSSFMWDHIEDAHNGLIDTKDAFRFEIVSSFRDPLERQIAEATRINQALNRCSIIDKKDRTVPVVSLNRRHEHFSPVERWEEANQKGYK